MNMKRAQQGFTLIELMIVIAIIGILAAIAIPSYQDYTAKSKFTAAQAELAGAKTAVDAFLNENGASVPTLTDAGLRQPTSNCSAVTVSAGADPFTMNCVILGGPGTVANRNITLTRTSVGAWSCNSSDISNAKLKSKSCGG